MTAERRERLKTLLVEAEALDQAARATWIEELRARDPDMALELESLLAVTVRSELRSEGLTEMMSEAMARALPPPLDLPRDLGPYRLLEVIGQGGMGIVYRATQQQPFQREVAIKALRGGWRPEELRARLAAERHALALMEHPGVARLYDVLADEHGTPYLVMEFVHGRPITDYAREHRLDRSATIQLFVTACRAVQHAHQRGILHRDLKPVNLLVTTVDGRPIAKVIDFGVARLLGGDDGPERLTRHGQLVGTLDYMSPEQASGRAVEADTRSDVYSLGVVLYELLAGRRPHDLEELEIHEAVKRVALGAPKPLRQAAGGLRAVPGDLEAIVHKAIAHEPARRYDGPGALADDLERFMRGEPVTARPPSAAYHLRVLMRRHRVAVLAGAAMLAMLVVFGVAMTVLYQAQRREHRRATLEAAKAAAINRFLVGLLEAPDPVHGANDLTVHELLDRKLAALPAEFGSQPEVMAEVQATLGRTYSGLGEFDRADSLLRLALAAPLADEARPEGKIRVMLDLAKNAQWDGRFAESREHALRVEQLAREWGRREPRAADRAAALRAAGLAAIGEALLSEGADPRRAEAVLVEAVNDERRRQPRGSPELAEVLLRLGRVYWALGPWSRAESVLTEAMALSERVDGPGHPRQIEILTNLGLVRRLQSKPRDAERVLREAVERTRREYGPHHAAMGPAMNNLAIALTDLGRHAEAESLLVEAIGVFEQSGVDFHEDMSAAHKNLAALFLVLDEAGAADALCRKAIAVSQSHHRGGHWLEVMPRSFLAHAHSLRNRTADAEREARTATELCLRHRGPGNPRTLAQRVNLAFGLLGAGHVDSARSWSEVLAYERARWPALRVLDRLSSLRPGEPLDDSTAMELGGLAASGISANRYIALEAARALGRTGHAADAAAIRHRLATSRAAIEARLRPEVHARAHAIARAAGRELAAATAAARRGR